MQPEMSRSRAVIEHVQPEIDGGRFPIKRVAGEKVVVQADIFTDGHDMVSCVLCYRREGDADWTEVPMTPLVNDRWQAEFRVVELGRYYYTLQAWVDHFKTWSRDLAKRVEAGQDVTTDLLIGAGMVEAASKRAEGQDMARLQELAATMRAGGQAGIQGALSAELADLMYRYAERRHITTYGKELAVVVDRVRARFGAWYEMFPRSCWNEPCGHGTFRDCEQRLPYIASMGFDVLYLPPIHPIGHTKRKGKTTAWWPSRTMWAVHGQSARKRVDTRPSTPGWALWTTSAASWLWPVSSTASRWPSI